MRAWVVGAAVVGTMLGAAAPAGAAQIGITETDNGPIPDGVLPTRAVYVVAAPGDRNDITGGAGDPTPPVSVETLEAGVAPLTRSVTHPGPTFHTTPPLPDSAPCEIL